MRSSTAFNGSKPAIVLRYGEQQPATPFYMGDGCYYIPSKTFVETKKEGIMNNEKNNGVYVYGVKSNGPAARAGIRNGDTIVALNGNKVNSSSDIKKYLRRGRENSVRIDRLRSGFTTPRFCYVTVKPKKFMGIYTSKEGYEKYLNKKGAKYMAKKSAPSTYGVKVLAVKVPGPAYRAGIREGDVITHIDGKVVYFPAAVGTALKSAKASGIVFKIRRNGNGPAATVTVHPYRGKKTGRLRVGLYVRPDSAKHYKDGLSAKKAGRPKAAVKATTTATKKKSWSNPFKSKEIASVDKPVEAKPAVAFNGAPAGIPTDYWPAPTIPSVREEATRVAVADAMKKAKAETLKEIESKDDNHFEKLAEAEMKDFEEMLADRKGADKLLAIRKLKRDLAEDNRAKLKAAGDKVAAYLKGASENTEKELAKADPGKRLSLTKLGWIVVTVTPVVPIALALYHYFG